MPARQPTRVGTSTPESLAGRRDQSYQPSRRDVQIDRFKLSSKINVFTRDGWRCQYCGARFAMSELDYDHELPRRQGGRTCWENIVTSCYACNSRKAGRTPEQAGMTLLRRPARPHALLLHTVDVAAHDVPEVWKPYLDVTKTHKYGDGYFLVSSTAT